MLRTRTGILLAVVAALFLVSIMSRAADVTVDADVTYARVGETELKLDIARPKGEGPFPGIVFIHGGGWHQGNRQRYQGEIRDAAKRGYVAATVSYRLMKYDTKKPDTAIGDPRFPAQIHDVKAAIRWLRANAKQYHLDGNRLGVTGESAGGHLSLLVGLTDSHANLEGDEGYLDQSSRVQAVVNVFGPVDMKTCYETSSVAFIFSVFLGGKPDEASETYQVASPLTYVSQDDPPVLTLHGDKDALVPLAQAKMLDQKMKEVGASHTLLLMEGAGHGFPGRHQKKAMQATWSFFDEHLKK